MLFITLLLVYQLWPICDYLLNNLEKQKHEATRKKQTSLKLNLAESAVSLL